MSYEKILHISERGQVVIPKKVRKIIGLNKNGCLKLSVTDNHQLLLQPIKGFTSELEGTAKGLLKKGETVLSYVDSLREGRE